MAHVLLPCDLPTWSEIKDHLSLMEKIKDPDELVHVMAVIYDICSISLEPEDVRQKEMLLDPRVKFEEFNTFLKFTLSPDDRNRFFNDTLPNLVSAALSLSNPDKNFLYSIKREDDVFELNRTFVKSLLANAFFSTFPQRTPKTHPCLQNFAFCDFFPNLYRRSQQKKLKAFLRYFQRNDDNQETNPLRFHRKVLSGTSVLSLPGWLCSDRPLIPLVTRFEGNIHEAEPKIIRAFQCCSLIGGDVLRGSSSMESSLFFAFPELLSSLCFIEQLEDNEAVIAEGVFPRGIRKSRQNPGLETTICLIDGMDFELDSDQQFQDKILLRELNKALVAFSYQSDLTENDLYSEFRRQTPVGESSSSDRRSSASSSSRRNSSNTNLANEMKRWKTTNLTQSTGKEDKNQTTDSGTEQKKSSYFPPITNHSEISTESQSSSQDNSIQNRIPSEFPKLPRQISKKNQQRQDTFKRSTSSSQSSTKSIKTASESSLELPQILKNTALQNVKGGEEVYYTADEDSDKSSERMLNAGKIRTRSFPEQNLSSLLISTSGLVNEHPQTNTERHTLAAISGSSSDWTGSKESSSRRTSSLSKRSDSGGFVLGGGAGTDEDADDLALESEELCERSSLVHERLDDFRKRIRCRTRRHLSRKMRSGSRSSYSLGSSTSSDMEDISEEEDLEVSFQMPHQYQVMRTSNSEPSLVNVNDEIMDIPPFTPGADTVMLSVGGRRVLVTSSNGQLKAYSYDGVSPNLPVPFKAKFRTRRKRNSSEESRGGLWMSSELGLGLERVHSRSAANSDDEQSHLSSSSLFSSGMNYPKRTSFEDYHYNLKYDLTSAKGKYPVAVTTSRNGDFQLRALLLWLAASMAGLPSLICYTAQDPQLQELTTVYRKVLSRKWSIGDLSCEVLRFCRNKLSPRRKSCPATIFEQLLNTGCSTPNATTKSISYRQHSLD